MTQQTGPTLSRVPVSVRKMVQIVSDPLISSTIATITALVTFGTWYYYATRCECAYSSYYVSLFILTLANT